MYYVLIVGYGEMGHAMADLLGRRHLLSIHDSRSIPDLPVIDLEKQASLADFVLLCVPASPLQEILSGLAPHLPKTCVCLSIAKGLDARGRTPGQIYQALFDGQRPHGVLYGPMISEEIRSGRFAFAELGCSNISIYRKVQDLFHDTRLLVRFNPDIPGISWCALLKNVYAIAFGVADGLELGDNMRGFLAVAALREMGEIVEHMGGKLVTATCLAGLGDLITTGTSAGSHHRQLGLQIATGNTVNITGEGIHTLNMVARYRLFDTSRYTLYNTVETIVRDPMNAEERLSDYISSIGQNND